MANQLRIREDLRRNRLNFVLAEIELGCTFATIALKATDPEKQQRNTKNARKAYDEALRFLDKTPLSDDERETLRIGMIKLRAALNLLNDGT